MKKLIIIAAMFVSQFSIGQTKSKVLTTATKWFKESYVQENFKDPYSYKELKCSIDSMSNKEYYTNDSTIEGENMRDAEDRMNEWKNLYEKAEKKSSFYLEYIEDYKKKYDLAKASFDVAKSILELMDAKALKKTHHYIIRIDCHANNSYGNQIFARYSLISYNGKQFSNVMNLN
jgi:hypothetical protein